MTGGRFDMVHPRENEAGHNRVRPGPSHVGKEGMGPQCAVVIY